MSRLGLFDLLGIQTPRPPKSRDTKAEQVILLPLRSGDDIDTKEVGKLQDDLVTLGKGFTARPYIFDGLAEAAANYIEHTYPDKPEPAFPYSAGHRW